MRIVAAIGLAAFAASCAPKLELTDISYIAQQAPTPPAQDTEEVEATASVTQTAKPAVRHVRLSPVRAQTVSAHDHGNAEAHNLAVPAQQAQPTIVTRAATVASSRTAERDGEAATQAAGVGATDRTPERGQEKAFNPAQETVLSPTRQTRNSAQEVALSASREFPSGPAQDVLSPSREIPRPVHEAALSAPREIPSSPAQATALNEGLRQASACIRNNIKAAYRSSETIDQATSFLMKICFVPFSSAIASDEASAKTLFRGLVFQEMSPVEWLQALEENATQGR